MPRDAEPEVRRSWRASLDHLQVVLRLPWQRQDGPQPAESPMTGPCRREQGPLRGLGRRVVRRPALERGPDPELVEAPLARAHHRPDRPARARPALFRRLDALPGVRLLGRVPPLQHEHPAQRRQERGHLLLEARHRQREGLLRTRPRARPSSTTSSPAPGRPWTRA